MATSATHVHDHDSGEGLLSVEDAREKVLSQVQPLATINLPLTEAHGCVLAEDAVASADIPDFPSSAMDGFAVRSSDVAAASPASPVELTIVGRAPIGRRPDATVGGGEAVRIAPGAPVLAGIVRDEVDELRDTVISRAVQADAFVSSGGVSVGERDVVKAAFFRRGDVEFFKVAMQPGMPQGFGTIEGKPYFGLPGNPVSVFVSFEVLIRPAILKMMGRTNLFRPEITARLTADVSGPKGKTQFARVLVRPEGDGYVASPTGGRGSNLIATVARANGLAIVPPGVKTAAAGTEVTVMVFRALED